MDGKSFTNQGKMNRLISEQAIQHNIFDHQISQDIESGVFNAR
jgi:hypothetical protein